MWGALKQLISSKSGATLVYVSITLAALLGFIGLAVDFSRAHVTSQQVQSAADAAALAAASQLDRTPDAIDRAIQAARGTPIVENSQRFGGTTTNSNVIIDRVEFITEDGLPASDSTPISESDFLPIATAEQREASSLEAEYVIVTTTVVGHKNLFLPFIGLDATSDVATQSVATQTSAICQTTPFFICNPSEVNAGDPFDVEEWKERQIRVIASASQPDSWGPGNFGFLDIPSTDVTGNSGNGAKSLAEQIASVNGVNQCFDTRVETSTGAMASLRSAINVRFDMYENPFFQDSNGANAPNKLDIYEPAPNVIKGRVFSDCGDEEDNTDAMGMPRDQNIIDSVDQSERLGNGNWDCPAYWAANHGGTRPTGCEATMASDRSTLSRWEIYKMEVEDLTVGIPEGDPDDASPSPEPGAPVCHDNNDPTTLDIRRRNVIVAIINCKDTAIKGKTDDASVINFVEAFLTEPVPTAGGGVEFDIYLEIIDVLEVGQADGVLKEFVEIVR